MDKQDTTSYNTQVRENNKYTTWWINESWINTHILDYNTVQEYFRESIFYERPCNNEVLLQNNQTIDKQIYMIGLEYIVDINIQKNIQKQQQQQQPLYFVIRKQWRVSSTNARLLGLYVVYNTNDEKLVRGGVYAMPDLYTVLDYKVDALTSYIYKFFNDIQTLRDVLQQQDHSITKKDEKSSIHTTSSQHVSMSPNLANTFKDTISNFDFNSIE